MSSAVEQPERSVFDVESAVANGDADGRVVRRERNMAAVRGAVLELMQQRKQPTLAAIAENAGVAPRSVHRYFGDVDTAVREAIAARRSRALRVFDSEPKFSPNAPLAERLGMLVLRRLRLDRLVEPLDVTGDFDELFDALDTEVRDAFAPELERGDEQLALLLCGLFRLRSVRSMREVFADDDKEIASALIRAASALIDSGQPH